MFLQTFNAERCIDAKLYFLLNNWSKNKIVHVVVSKLYCNVSFVWIGSDLRKEERKMGLACGTVHPRGQTKFSPPLAPPPPPPLPAGQLVPSPAAPDDDSFRCCRFPVTRTNAWWSQPANRGNNSWKCHALRTIFSSSIIHRLTRNRRPSQRPHWDCALGDCPTGPMVEPDLP